LKLSLKWSRFPTVDSSRASAGQRLTWCSTSDSRGLFFMKTSIRPQAAGLAFGEANAHTTAAGGGCSPGSVWPSWSQSE